MGELGLGTLPVRRDDGRIRGVLSRDMVIACIAEGGDPASVTATDIAQPMPSAGDAQAADILVEPDLDTGQGAGVHRLAEVAVLEGLPDRLSRRRCSPCRRNRGSWCTSPTSWGWHTSRARGSLASPGTP